MSRTELSRLFEVWDECEGTLCSDAYSFDTEGNPLKLKQLRDIEAELQKLDPDSWDYFKSVLAPLMTIRVKDRGWQPLFDRLNEAKGYNHLLNIGCTDITFIRTSDIPSSKTPDLQGTLGNIQVLCEVKTVNVSESECSRRVTGGVGSTAIMLAAGFFSKLKSDLQAARNQMVEYDRSGSARKIAYVVINYDDSLHEYVEQYSNQLGVFVSTEPLQDVEVILNAKPAFYSAIP